MLEKLRLFPEQASTVAPRVDALLYFLLAVTVVFVTLIAGLIVVFMVRYRRGRPGDGAAAVHGSLGLEALWSAVPFALTIVMFFWGASLYATLRRPPDDALEVHVVGKQWMWKVQHLEGRREINELHVPVGRPVKVTLTSEDVIHSFFVPAFRTKQDAVPGRYTTLWFEATRPGSYALYCTEYCGTLHAGMIGRVVAMEPAAFQSWLGAGEPAPAVASAGERVFRAQGCPSCHAADAPGRGPALGGVFGSAVRLRDGATVRADEAYLRESILVPQAQIVAGYDAIMPTFQGLLGEEELLELITYLKGLPAPREDAP
jgi:cytochrome c oxidase subunit 2